LEQIEEQTQAALVALVAVMAEVLALHLLHQESLGRDLMVALVAEQQMLLVVVVALVNLAIPMEWDKVAMVGILANGQLPLESFTMVVILLVVVAKA
jgi:hypothetical protein